MKQEYIPIGCVPPAHYCMGGLCSRGVSVQWGISVQWGVSVQGGLCPGDLGPGGVSVPGDLCLGGLCPGGSLSRASLSRGSP